MPQIDVQKYDIQGVNCSDRIKAGLTLGIVVGVTIGGFFGAAAAFRHGIRGKEMVRQVGKQMLNVGASFGTFMAIGTMLRC